MSPKILVPLDGSKRAEQDLPLAATLHGEALALSSCCVCFLLLTSMSGTRLIPRLSGLNFRLRSAAWLRAIFKRLRGQKRCTM